MCSSSLEWIPLQSCVRLLDRFQFTPLRPDLAAQRADVHAACSSSSSDQGQAQAQASTASFPPSSTPSHQARAPPCAGLRLFLFLRPATRPRRGRPAGAVRAALPRWSSAVPGVPAHGAGRRPGPAARHLLPRQSHSAAATARVGPDRGGLAVAVLRFCLTLAVCVCVCVCVLCEQGPAASDLLVQLR